MPTTGYKIRAGATTDLTVPTMLNTLAEALRRLIAADPDLPPILSLATNGRNVEIHPWLACGPITALLAWARHLDGTVDYRATELPNAIGTDTPIMTITSTGKLGGMTVTVTASTYRSVPTEDALGRVTAETLSAIAAEEQPLTGDDMTSLLDSWADSSTIELHGLEGGPVEA